MILEKMCVFSQLWAGCHGDNCLFLFQAIIHPDTGGKIPMPFRVSGFVPFGTPIVVGLLLPNQTLFATAAWQWINQTHNACINYCNRNASQVSFNFTQCNNSMQQVVIEKLGK